MFYYTILIAAILFTVSSKSIPTKLRAIEPERCCTTEKYSGQIISNTGTKLPNGKGDAYYVRAFLDNETQFKVYLLN